MTKVEQGIEINSQHLYNVLNDIPEEVSFRDQIIELGYDTIEQFFEEKAAYEMQEVLTENVSSVSMPQLIPFLQAMITQEQFGVVFIYTDGICVCSGQNEEKILNREYCEQNNIPIYPYDSFGGSIVADKDDFGLAILLPEFIDISAPMFLHKIVEILSKYFENVTIQGNDILINNKKVIGSGSFGNDQVFIMLLYFSMSDKGVLIENICGQPTTGKEPGYIDPEVVSAKKLQGEVLLWLQEH